MDSMRARLAHILSASGPKLFRDLVSLATGQSVSMIVGFVAFAYLARTYSPEDYGSIEFAIAIAAFSAIVIECGAGTIGVRQLAKTPEDAPNLATQIPVARLLIALAVIPLVAVSGYILDLDNTVALLVLIYAVSLIAVPLKQEWLLQGFEKIHQAAAALPIRTAVFAAGVFLLVGQGTSIVTVGIIELFAVGAVSIYYLFAQYRWTVPFRLGWPFRDAIYFIREGFAVGMSNILWAFMLYAPMFLLVSLVGGEEPAWLGASSRLVISLLTLSFVYHFNLYPVITRTVLHDIDGWKRVIQASIRLVAWAGIGFALAVTLFAPVLITFLFGAAFETAATSLSVLIWIFPMRMLSGHARWSLIAFGAQKFLLIAEVIGATSLLLVGFLAIPHIGAVGAALALTTGILVSGVVTQIAANKHIGRMNLPQAIWQPMLAASIAAAAAVWTFDEPLLRTLVGGAVFGTAMLTNFKRLMTDIQRIGYAKEF